MYKTSHYTHTHSHYAHNNIFKKLAIMMGGSYNTHRACPILCKPFTKKNVPKQNHNTCTTYILISLNCYHKHKTFFTATF